MEPLNTTVRFDKGATDLTARSRLVDFFQYLTQAVNKVDRCALVASLLASDPRRDAERLQRNRS